MKDSTTYVGMDVHKNQHKVAMLLPGTEQPKEWSIQASAAEVRRMVQRVQKDAPGPVVFCYEAGVCGFALQRQIESQGVACQVIAPSLTPVQPGQRIQTDRRDARKLAGYLRSGLLTEVQAPSEEEESVRDLVRCRDAARKDLMRIRHQVGKFLLRRGVHYAGKKNWTLAHVRWLRTLRFERPAAEVVWRNCLEELDRRAARLDGLDEHLERISQQEPYRRAVGWLRCFRGIDTITAMILLTELYAFGRFPSAPKLMSFLGLTPSESSSGDSRRLGGLTKAGNGRVRRALVEAAWHQRQAPGRSKTLRERRAGQPDWVVRKAEQAERRLHRRYWRLVHRGKPPVKAVSAVARELVGFVWSILFYQGPAPTDRPAGQELPADRAAAEESAAGDARPSLREFFASGGGDLAEEQTQAGQKGKTASGRGGRGGKTRASAPGRAPSAPS